MAKKYKSVRDRRLAREYEKVQELCRRSTLISYKILRETRRNKLPEKYEITYTVKSIIGINDDQSPIYGNEHKVEITLPRDYPSASSPPILTMKTDTWHPNIRATDPYKGRVCVNAKAISGHEGLDDLILRFGEILQYKNYLADDSKPPYPEDIHVAQWVREYAEPKGLINYDQGKVIDDRDLIDIEEDKAQEDIVIGGQIPDEDVIIDITDDNDNDDNIEIDIIEIN